MTPDFALSLSFDGIALLRRVPDGWHLVGEVPLDRPDLSQALAELRGHAQRLDGTGIRCKLVIPHEQIKFMALDSEKTTRLDVERELEGKTPYALHELVIDDYRIGGKTHVAAVARETLDEAESFAREHGFDPVASVAVPEPGTFPGEVFFGAAKGVAAGDVGRDRRPVVQTGTVVLGEDAGEPAAAEPKRSETAVETATDLPETVATDDVPVTAPVVAIKAATGDRPDIQTKDHAAADAEDGDAGTAPVQTSDALAEAHASDPVAEPAEADAASDLPAAADPGEDTIAAQDTAAPSDAAEPTPVPAPPRPAIPPVAPAAKLGETPMFASRNRKAAPLTADRTTAATGNGVDAPPRAGTLAKAMAAAAPRMTAADTAVAGTPRQEAARPAPPQAPVIGKPTGAPVDGPKAPAPRVAGAAGPRSPAATPVPPPADEPLFTRRKEPPPPMAAKGRMPAPPVRPGQAPAAATGAAIATGAAATAPAAPATPRNPMPVETATMAPPPATPVAAGRLSPAPVSAAAAAPRSDRRIDPAANRTADAQPAVAPRRGKPRFLGLIMTAVLLLVLLLIGLWAATLPPGGIAGWFRGSDDATAVATAPSAEPDSIAPEPAIAAAADSAVDSAPADTATLTTAEPIAPADAEVTPAVQSDTAVATAEPETAAQITPPPAPIVRAAVGRVLSPDEADRIYAATGVYQRAPRIAVMPRGGSLDDLTDVAEVAAPTAQPAPTMPTAETVQPDPLIATPPAPPGPDVTFARDSRGNILATEEGTITPQGAVVFAGSPDLRPVLRPGSAAPAATEAATQPINPGAIPMAPQPRPDDLVQAAVTDLAVSPVRRPSDLVDDAQTGADATVQTAAFTTGPPPLRPVLRPTDAAPAAPTEDDSAVAAAPLPPFTGVRPQTRPASLTPEVAAVVTAYTGTRPVLRPTGLAPDEAAEADVAEAAPEETPEPAADINAIAAAIAAAAPPSSFTNRTALAVSVARRPDVRPRNFAQVVARARTAAAPQAPAQAAPAPTRTAAVAATPAPPTIVAPSGNIPGGVAQAATIGDAMNLRQMNLVGVYGKPNERRALVRLGNGRYVKVAVGSSLDGGQVTAIGDTALNFVKRGRTYALTLPG